MSVSAIPKSAVAFQAGSVAEKKSSTESTEALSIGPGILIFLGVHVLIGFVTHNSSMASAVHALVTFAVGMYVALFDRRLERVAYVSAYIVGGEVLWHMTEAPILWEFGKYSIVAVFLTAILANRLVKLPALPIFYFVLLVPSIWITLIEEDFTSRSEDFQSGRDMISFNMSGPLALMVSAWFLSHVKLSKVQVQRLFLAALGPIVSVA